MALITPPKPTNCIAFVSAVENTSGGYNNNPDNWFNCASVFNAENAAGSATFHTSLTPKFGGSGTIADPYHFKCGGADDKYIDIPYVAGMGATKNVTIGFVFIPEVDLNLPDITANRGIAAYSNGQTLWEFGFRTGSSNALYSYIKSNGVSYMLNPSTGAAYGGPLRYAKAGEICHVTLTYGDHSMTYNGETFTATLQTNYFNGMAAACAIPDYDIPESTAVTSMRVRSYTDTPFKLLGAYYYNTILDMSEIKRVGDLIIHQGVGEDFFTNALLTVESEVIKTINPHRDGAFCGFNNDAYDNFNRCAPENTMFVDDTLVEEAVARDLRKYNINTLRGPHAGHNDGFNLYPIIHKDNKNALTYAHNMAGLDLTWTTSLDEILPVMKRSGLKLGMQVNIHTYPNLETKQLEFIKDFDNYSGTGDFHEDKIPIMASNTAAQVRYINQNGYRDTVVYYELGNEEFAQDASNGQCFYLAPEYAKVAAAHIDAIISEDPTAKIIMPMYVGYMWFGDMFAETPELADWYTYYYVPWMYDVWNDPLIQARKQYISGFTMHRYGYRSTYYRDGSTNNPQWSKTESPYRFLTNTWENYKYYSDSCQWTNLTQAVNSHAKLLQERIGIENPKIYMTEWNNCKYGSPYIHTWNSAISDARGLLGCVNASSCEHVDYYTITTIDALYHKGTPNYPLYSWGAFMEFRNYKLEPFCNGFVLAFINKHLNGDVYKVSSNNQGVEFITIKKGNFVKVLILSLKETHNVTLDLSEFSDLALYQTEHIIYADDYRNINWDESLTQPRRIRPMKININGIEVTKGDNNAFTMSLGANSVNLFKFKLS